ncbi:protease Do-like protein 10, mitochondrial [Tanacetum coccineum]|uniref:Protease Do-like protein 10, mitochondrial n=1 Tax=Tanacetum coccineum TaxID=301880 RepID=A0ABQ5H5J4_9ASTR
MTGVRIRTSLPLPSLMEIISQLVVYFLEDYTNYWIHNFFIANGAIRKFIRSYDYILVVDYLKAGCGLSRVERTQYVHGATQLLAIQIDAAINPGNSGGPAIMASGNYSGFCSLGLSCQPTDNLQLREYFSMRRLLVSRTNPLSNAYNILKKDDIVLSFDVVPIANDGTGRIYFPILLVFLLYFSSVQPMTLLCCETVASICAGNDDFIGNLIAEAIGMMGYFLSNLPDQVKLLLWLKKERR